MKASVHNLGCKTNQYETDAMAEALAKAGYEIVPFTGDIPADVYVVNTCSVTNIADRKSRQMLHKAKSRNPNAVIVATGCYVQANAENMMQDEAVDIIIGSSDKSALISAIEDFILTKERKAVVKNLKEKVEFEKMSLTSHTERTRAYIKIEDGCDQYCTYCIIPYVRGHVRSRPIDDIVREVRSLTETGITEVVLTGINMSAYGSDLSDDINLSHVINEICKVDKVKRIRISSLDPQIITEEFLNNLTDFGKLCAHFHLSLQSGCDNILKKMNRGYTTTEYREKCELLRDRFDDPAITTDIIVGFPGETEEDFNDTINFVDNIGFSAAHIFQYSPKEGTVAARMEEQIPPSLKADRSKRLIKETKNLKYIFNERWIGKTEQVLIEETVYLSQDNTVSKEFKEDSIPYLTGYTERYIRCLIKYDSSVNIGDIVKVKIGEHADNDNVYAEIIHD